MFGLQAYNFNTNIYIYIYIYIHIYIYIYNFSANFERWNLYFFVIDIFI